MKDQFVTYEIAKALKELGFNEPCLAYWLDGSFKTSGNDQKGFNPFEPKLNPGSAYVGAPLWQQVIDWLRINHNITITEVLPAQMFAFQIWVKGKLLTEVYRENYVQAREKAIIKSIQFIKTVKG